MIAKLFSMKAPPLLLTFLLFFSLVQGKQQPDQIIQIFRHGARGPLTDYDSSWPSYQWGQLTPVGLRQHYILGKVLAEKYSHLFEEYDYNQVYLLADNTQRCIQSAEAQLYGMYLGSGPSLKNTYPSQLAVPPYQDQRVKELAASLPNVEAIPNNNIPNIVNIIDQSNAIIFQGDLFFFCPNQGQWSQENSNDTLAQEAWELFQDTVNNANQYLDDDHKLTALYDLVSFGDFLLVNLADNRALPGGLRDQELIYNLTMAFTLFDFHVNNGQLIQRQLGAFNIMNEVLKQLKAFKTGQQDSKKIALYSGHDTNLLAILGALGVINEDCLMKNFKSHLQHESQIPYPDCYFPYFASDIIFEFYNDTTAPFVKVYYNNQILPLCNGQEACSYDDFVVLINNSTGNNTIETYNKKCGNQGEYRVDRGGEKKEESLNQNMMEIVGLWIMTILCSGLLLKNLIDNKKYNKLLADSSSEVMSSEIN